MHDQRCLARTDPGEAEPDARDLILKALSARRPCMRGVVPELRIDVATAGRELVMPPAGPDAKILLAEFADQLGVEPKRARRLDRAARRAGIASSIARQQPPQRLQRRAIAEVGRCVGCMDRACDAVDGRMTYQPEEGVAFHGELRASWWPRQRRRDGHIDPVLIVFLDGR